jgi:hypothetical protein
MWALILICLMGQVREQPPIFPPEGWEIIKNQKPIKPFTYTRWYLYEETVWEREARLNQPIPYLLVPRPPVPYLPGANYVPPDVGQGQQRPLQNLRLPLKGILGGRR